MCLLLGAEGQGSAAPGAAEGAPLQPSFNHATLPTASFLYGELNAALYQIAACIVQVA